MRAMPLVLAIMALGLTSCTSLGGASGPPSEQPTATPQPTATATPQPTLPAIPAQLRGEWQTTLSYGEQLTLTLTDTGYQVKRGTETVHGGLRVADGQITFLRSGECDGVGTYQWSLTGGQLTFQPVAADQCPGRAGVIVGQTYTLAGG
ncbi:MAG: hypothetical protein ABI622_08790 [Chloroflexota bacterium]